MKKAYLILIACVMLIGSCTSSSYAQEVLPLCLGQGLYWQANTEPDMDHYTVYYRQTSNIVKGDTDLITMEIPHTSPVGLVSLLKIGGLEDGPWYFRLTASDKTGNESEMSNEVGCFMDRVPAIPVLELRQPA